MIKSYLSLLFAILLFSSVYAQEKSDPALLTIDRIYKNREFSQDYFGQIRWLDNGQAYTKLERSEAHKGARDIWAYESKDAKGGILLSASDIIPEGSEKPLRISDYKWSNNKKWLLIFTNTRRVWRYHTRGDYWLLNIENGQLQQIGKGLAESSLMFAKFSPDDTRIAFVSEHNVYIEEIPSGLRTQLTNNGSNTLINGTFDWAYEEEFGCRDGFRWSPDGQHIAYWQVDASGIRDFLMINNTDSVYSHTIPVQYPKVGEDPSACRIGVISAKGGPTKWMEVPGDSKQNYLPRMQWGTESKALYIQQLNRKQNELRLWETNINSGNAKLVYEEKDEAWIDPVNEKDWLWLEGGTAFTWKSEKDGWRNVYKMSKGGEQMQMLSPGNFDVISIEEIDLEGGWMYYIASPENPTQRYLYRTPLDGSQKSERLSPENQQGSHSYNVAPGAKYAIHTFSNIHTPPIKQLISLPDHKQIKLYTDNAAYKAKIDELALGDIEFFKVKTADDVEMDGYMIKPPNFDPDKKYPVLFYVYGEPAGQTARDTWQSNLWHRMMTQKGFIIITMDNRGTPSPKGKAWRKSIYRKIGVVNSRDQAMATKEVLKWPFIDAERVAVWGWSGGGSMTLNLLFRYPEIYKTGISVAPVANQLFYDNIYQERYMGVPWENKEDFLEGSPVTYAKNLEGNLLLIHGTGDDNVHYQNAEVLINELVKHNKIFQVMPYPNRSHGIWEGPNTTRHLYSTMTDYLLRNVETGAK